ncbi:hypothetical protein [Prochlorococcus sp. MIT 1303]|uniref:hypothetical protein n=1 Tax=Prochlorococcus sp. MIT 1303 TaxID=1723647 RepID=UPI0007B3C361|nr:hypothetical protein [Prochlorococcus sp. MIT 1303]KZR62132.1 hypothetical protein PMIT1303_02335 [Prochlorococcus sp. MIT 1303]
MPATSKPASAVFSSDHQHMRADLLNSQRASGIACLAQPESCLLRLGSRLNRRLNKSWITRANALIDPCVIRSPHQLLVVPPLMIVR